MKKVIAIIGPTATGKTTLAAHLAYRLNGEVIGADSRQVYRKMDIGTGKDLSDFTIDKVNIPYHLIDIVYAGYKYNLYEYQKDFFKVYQDIINRNKTPIICGGTGLYIEAVLKGYKLMEVPPDINFRKSLEGKSIEELIAILSTMKQLHNVSDFDSKKRMIRAIEIATYYQTHPESQTVFPTLDYILFGIHLPREIQRQRITERLTQRLETGMIDEAERLLKSGLTPDDLIYYGLEYKFLALHITGKLSYQEMVKLLETAIHQFSKRQMTWYRKMEREGFEINWIDGNLPLEDKIKHIQSLL